MGQQAEPEFLAMPEAAMLLGMSELSLRRRVRAGKLPVYRSKIDRRRYLIKADDLADFRQPERVIRRRAAEAREGAAAA